jgi:hypothetical protein
MSDRALERRCRLLARAYPDGPRAAEVFATLMDSNAGRSRPRAGDAIDVARHGLAARLRGVAPGTRYGRWGDAAAVAIVLFAVMQASALAAIAVALTGPGQVYLTYFADGSIGSYLFGAHPAVLYGAALLALVAVAAATATCLGRVRAARLLTAPSGSAPPAWSG